MNTYIMVHGMWHGAWCWFKVIPGLQKAGHRAIAVDLPGHGIDRTPIPQLSLKSYVDRVCQILDDQSEPVILVGHSFGGIVNTQVAEYRPDKIKKLVYLCALVPLIGESSLKMSERGQKYFTALMQNMVMSVDKSYSTIKREGVKDLLYHDCSDEDVTLADSLLCPEPSAPSLAPVNITEGNFGRVPKVYIQALQDKTIPSSFQEIMYSAIPFQKIIQMNTSHSPFFSAPDELVGHLLSL
jgi:pimeloyl-ACP methyl ester carboxylesterase